MTGNDDGCQGAMAFELHCSLQMEFLALHSGCLAIHAVCAAED